MSYTDDIVNNIVSMLEQGSTADGEPNSLKHVPEQDPDIQRSQLANDMGGGEEYEEVDDEIVTDELDEALSLVDDILDEQDSAYQAYFRGVMKKHGVTQIKTMSPEKKKEFFKDVSNGWRSRKKVKEQTDRGMKMGLTPSVSRQAHAGPNKGNARELNPPPKGSHSQVGRETSGSLDESQLYEEYKKYFQYMLDECGIEDFSELSETDQAEFMGLVNEAFLTMNEKNFLKQWGQQELPVRLSRAVPGPKYKSLTRGRGGMATGAQFDKELAAKRGRKLITTGPKWNPQYIKKESEHEVAELMQKPGAPIENPMSPHANMLDTLKNRMQAGRRQQQMAAAKAALPRRPVMRRPV